MTKTEIIRQIEKLPKFEDKKELFVEKTKQEDLKPITPVGDDKAVSVVSKFYKLVQHEDAFKRALKQLNMPEEIEGWVSDYKTKAAVYIIPKGKTIGLWLLNSVDSTSAIRANFFEKKDFGSLYIPFVGPLCSIEEYKLIHRGAVADKFENFFKVLGKVKPIWKTIVKNLSKIEAKGEPDAEKPTGDYEAVKGIAGKRAWKSIRYWLERKRGVPSLWELILKSIKSVSDRLEKSKQVASVINKEERLRQISTMLIAYALKEA